MGIAPGHEFRVAAAVASGLMPHSIDGLLEKGEPQKSKSRAQATVCIYKFSFHSVP